MGSRVFTGIAWVTGGVTLAMIVGAVILSLPNDYETQGVAFLVPEAAAALIGALVAARRPGNPVGWLVLAHAFCFSLGEFTRQYALYGLVTEPGSLPLAGATASFPYWIWFPGVLLMFVLFPLYFPDGQLVSRRWRPVVFAAVVATFVLAGTAAVQPGDFETPGIPNPLGIEGLDGAVGSNIGNLVPLAWLGLGTLSATSLAVRFRRSRRVERQQIKWVLYAVVLLILLNTVETLTRELQMNLRLPPAISELLIVLALGGLWASIAVAVFRYRLYDIDVIINRTLVYSALTAVLALTYFGGVALLQAVFQTLTGQEQ
jgi:hypothetical protein